ncbi:MAG: 2,3-bisphosphoglycerate-independent phosphoglycerate mutase [Candidatus Limnocylindrales bacterium]
MTTRTERPRPVVLVVVDGFGYGPDPAADAIAAADMPQWRALLAQWPHSKLDASAVAVGLPEGQMGNSEVGHLNIGAGRPVLQDLPRIDAEIADGTFKSNAVLLAAVRHAAQPGSRLHLVGLIGPGGVHSTDGHAVAIAQLAHEAGVEDVVVHGLLDGRDTPPRSADSFIPDFERRLAAVHPGARFAMIGGRYYGMDRDQRWERTKAWYDAMVYGLGYQTAPAASAEAALATAYARGENDEFVKPTLIDGVDGTVRDGDVVIHFNFRADRARQLTHALVDEDFEFFDRGATPPFPTMVTLTEYEGGLPVEVAYPPMVVPSLAGVVSGLGWKQFHVAETEKYAHVTYFMNGGVETPWPGEERVLVPSPKVATYDLLPEMSAQGVADEIVKAVGSGRYDLIIANFANPDMVGHTGVWDATVRACEFLDGRLAEVAEAVLAADARSVAAGGAGALLAITADHGNADVMIDAEGKPVTKHSLSLVPFLLAGSPVRGKSLADGVLADVTPTLMALTGVTPAEGMSGRNLLED